MSVFHRYFCFAIICCIAFDMLLVGGSFAKADTDVPQQEETHNQQVFTVQSEMETEQIAQSDSCATQTAAYDSYDDTAYKTELAQCSDVMLPYGCFDENYFEDTVFIGDSNTEGLAVYGFLPQRNVFGKRSMTVGQALNTRFVTLDNGTTVTAVEAAEQFNPQRIVINLGTNNTVGTTAQDFALQYKNIVAELKTACPDSDIIVAAVLPVGYYRENNNIKQQTVDSFNLALVQLCRSENLYFLNYSEVFKNQKGYMNTQYVASDGIHLNSSGYSLLLEYVNTHQLVTTQTKVNNVPAQNGGTGDIQNKKIIYDPF